MEIAEWTPSLPVNRSASAACNWAGLNLTLQIAAGFLYARSFASNAATAQSSQPCPAWQQNWA